jgi:predicted porin
MKKTLVAMATLSVVGSAFADVDVSGGIKMYGVLDQGLTATSLTSASTGSAADYKGMFAANATSRLGFKGSRDLSGDLKGIFQAEIQLDPDTATLLPTKNRTGFVGLQSKDAGSLLMGTMETTAYEVFGMDVNGRIEYKPQVWRTTTSLDLLNLSR